jgi:tetratricopeptide (TPR) repeat protein
VVLFIILAWLIRRRTSNLREAGQRLLAAAVAAYRQALEVQTREHLPQDWAQTQYCLAQAYLGLKSWLNAATSFAQLLQVYPDDEEAYYAAHVLYHEKLFAFEEAFALSRQWLRRHSADVEAQSQFAEQCLTTGRFAEAAEYFASLLADSTLEPRLKVPLQALEIVARLALHPNEPISEQLQCLRVTITGQAKNFSLGWTFGGVKHFVGQEARLTPYRAWLLKLFTALEKKDREAMLTDVLYAIIAFETYDVIAGPKRRFETIVPIIHRRALTTLGLGAPPTTSRSPTG